MRHGNTESNMGGIVSFKKQKDDHLTIEGRKQVIATANYLKDKNIDLIVTSPFTRTKETTEIVRDVFGLTNDQIVEDDRIHELDPGDYDGKSWEEYHEHVKNTGPDWFERKIANGESYADVKRRTAEALYELEEKYKDKKILIVTHGAPAWLFYVNSGLFEPDGKEYHPANFHAFIKDFKRFENAEFRPLPFSAITSIS
jgi:broad specificity phosphatase PhoE